MVLPKDKNSKNVKMKKNIYMYIYFGAYNLNELINTDISWSVLSKLYILAMFRKKVFSNM